MTWWQSKFSPGDRTGGPFFIAPLLLWLVLGLAMLEASGDTPVTRTQEARVLVTAREMKDKPLRDWLIPRANGQTRLRKPPLAYWLTAGSFNAFGESTRTGRLPMTLAGWLTVGLTFAIGRRLIGGRAALLGAGALAGSWLFFKHAILAETDILMACGLMAALYASVRATEANDRRAAAELADAADFGRGHRVRSVLWWHAAGLALALSTLTKGPQAGCFLLFLVVLDGMRRQWRTGWTRAFLRSGAPATWLAVALPWFVYAMTSAQGGQLTDDLANSAAGGEGHAGPPWLYVGMLAGAAMPWTPLAIGALVFVAAKWKRVLPAITRHPGAGVLTAWSLALLVPLLCWGNKQPHYLMPVMPALMLGVGAILANLTRRSVDGALDAVGRFRRVGRGWLAATLIALLIVSPGVPLFAWWNRQFIAEDVYECLIGLAVAATLLLLYRRQQITLAGVAVVASASTFFLATDEWMEKIQQVAPELVARELHQRFPHAHFVFRNEVSLPLCFSLGQVVPVVDDAELGRLADADTGGRPVICLDVSDDQQALPQGFKKVLEMRNNRKTIVVATPVDD